jgi:exopolyphosphatase/guanosine-5'-triphosphate,3'-diphosphate pyrophosphatase
MEKRHRVDAGGHEKGFSIVQQLPSWPGSVKWTSDESTVWRKSAMRLASIDLGSNSLIMTVADSSDGQLTPVKEEVKIVRLGQALQIGGRLQSEAKERCFSALHSFAHQMEHLGVDAIIGVGTAALRNASDGQQFVDDIKEQLHIPIQIISGDDEARLTFKAVQRDFSSLGDSLVMIDIGGGSTELVIGDLNSITSQISLDAGTVSFSERFIRNDPPTSAELHSAARAINKMMDIFELQSTAKTAVGVAGTVTSLKAVQLEMDDYDHSKIHGTVLLRHEISQLGQLFTSMSREERMNLKGLPQERADIIPMGVVIIDSIMERLQHQSITISDRGLRWGLLYEWIEKNG